LVIETIKSGNLKRNVYAFNRNLIAVFKKIPGVLILLFSLFLVTSCIPQKKIIYFQDKEGQTSQNQFTNHRFQYKLRAGDEVMVKIVGLDDKTASLFLDKNSQNANLTQNSQGGMIYYQTLTLNEEGYIPFPTIGKINIKGLNIFDARKIIQDSLNSYVNYGSVEVKLANFKVNVLGEVNNPGTFYNFDEEGTILDAISMAGDLTEYGNRQKISVIRQNENGTQIVCVNLTDKSIFTSPVYYLQPGDVVYIPALGAKAFGFANFQWSVLFSVISTTFSAISIIVLLNK